MRHASRIATTHLLLAVIAIAISGCSSWWDKKEPPVDPNLFPTDYRKEILNTMKASLPVNTNVRDAFISEPVMRQVDKEQRYTVCVRSNSRNMQGVYTGSKDRIAYFFGGHLNQLVDATPEQCGNAAYKAFPELERVCQAKECK